MTKFLGQDTIVGDLPSDWTFYPVSYPNATPGAQWIARILRICRFDQFRIGYEYKEVKGNKWIELEIWYADLDKTIKAGKVWKRHINEMPKRIP